MIDTNKTRTARGWEVVRLWAKLLLQPMLIFAAGLLVIVALGLAQRIGWLSAGGGAGPVAEAPEDAVYTCPMDPQIRQPTAGRCPICGMELVVAAAGGGDLDELAVHIEPAARRVANITTVAARRAPLKQSIRTIGSITYNEGTLASISAYVDGRLERLYADYTGVRVTKGDELALLYSPQLYAVQEEFVGAKKSLERAAGSTLPSVLESQRSLLDGARQKLRELGMTDEQLSELERSGEAQSRMQITAPAGGTVIEKLAVEGQYIKTGDRIYRIADLSSVWLMLELFPEDASRIRYGQRVQAVVQSLPRQRFVGRVAFIDPIVKETTRTVGVRVVISNEGETLRPGDYATATIEVDVLRDRPSRKRPIYDEELAGKWISPRHPHVVHDQPGQCDICGIDLVPTTEYGFAPDPVPEPAVLAVPRDAVLMAGNNSVVYVETEPGRFEIRPVVVGPISEGRAVILEGIQEGDQVAVSGNFLIDSQMQLAGKPSVIDPSKAKSKAKDSGPLQLEPGELELVAGSLGDQLEQLYQAYFAVQATLAADQPVADSQARSLQAAASLLVDSMDLPDPARALVQTVAQHTEHMSHQDLEQARREFKPISKAIIQLAARVRGADSETNFIHFYCPMVPEGEGDWLQPSKPLANPYWGSKMLRCGTEVQSLLAAKTNDAGAGQPAAGTDEPRHDHTEHQRGEA